MLAGALTLVGLLSAIASFASAATLAGLGGSSTSAVLGGIGQLLLYPAAGFVVLTLGRLAVEHAVWAHKDREQRGATD